MNPRVSIIIATYNYGRFLAGALASALGQTFHDLEVIIVDDGSTDDTPAVVRPFLADRRVCYYRTGHAGPAAAKNRGIRLARAPLLAFLDGDDLWLPSKLERQLALLDADPSLGLVYTRRLLIDERGRPLEYAQPTLHRGWVLKLLFQTNFICCSSVLIRSEVFETVGPFDESLALAIDYDLWLRVALRYPIDYVDEALVKYRTGHANLSRRAVERLHTADRIMQRFWEEHGTHAGLEPSLVRQARAVTRCQIGLERRRQSRLAALSWYLRALALAPSCGQAWWGLASLPLPEAVRRGLRRALGRPVDWSVRRPLVTG